MYAIGTVLLVLGPILWGEARGFYAYIMLLGYSHYK
jgi:hypothetical protein